jgi:tetratricopeptide (TPR) repeat protein
MRHPADSRLRRIARILARVTPAEIDHIISCESCRRRLLALAAQRQRSPQSEQANPSEVLEQLEEFSQRCGERIRQEHDSAPALLVELLAATAEPRLEILSSEGRFQTYALACHAVEQSQAKVSSDPALARDLAGLALAIVAKVDPNSCGGVAALSDLEAYAQAMLANALRVVGDLPQATAAFAEARKIQRRGGVDLELTARIDALEASLRRDLRKFGQALALLDKAIKAFLSLEDRDRAVGAMINRANVYFVMRHFREMVATLQDALPLTSDPWLLLCIRHNLVFGLLEAGEVGSALEIFEQSQNLYTQFPDPLTISRRIWGEGLIHRELGDLDRAAALLSDACTRFKEHGYTYDCALATLDLCAVHLRQGDRTLLPELAGDLVLYFQSRQIHPEAFAALALLQQCRSQA